MARLTRKNMKVFAGNATNNGVFGSLQANNPVTTTDVETIQSLSAWGEGWDSATVTGEKLPPLEEFQGVQYVTTYQQAYLMQEGIPEWSASVTYYKGCLAKEVTSTGFRIYNSLTNDNTGNMLSDTSNWKKIMDSDDLYAFDNAVVHKTGAETISGVKTFSNGQISNSIEVFPKTGDTNCFINFHHGGISQYTARLLTNPNGTLAIHASIVTVPTPNQDTTSSTQADSVGARNTKINSVLSALYPVGSIYIGTQSTCPLSTLIPNSTWELVAANKSLWTGDGTNANTTIEAGIPNHTHAFGRQSTQNNGNFVWNNQNEDYVLGTQAGSIYYNGSGDYNYQTSYDAGASVNESLGNTYTLSTSLAKTDNLESDGVFGNATTVQPPAYVVNVWRRTA